jgi:hypothetical protein
MVNDHFESSMDEPLLCVAHARCSLAAKLTFKIYPLIFQAIIKR